MKGFVSDKFQSVNTMRNSLSPISIGKDQRFRAVINAGAKVPFHNIKVVEDPEFKNGWGFGYTKRKPFDREKFSFIPSPDHYYGPNFSNFKGEKDFKKCTFGETF
jgi:hypothetical protein